MWHLNRHKREGAIMRKTFQRTWIESAKQKKGLAGTRNQQKVWMDYSELEKVTHMNM